MKSRSILAIVLASMTSLLAACATTSDPGWRGEGATPFGTAEAKCRAEAAADDQGGDRDSRFEACMAREGWVRGGRP